MRPARNGLLLGFCLVGACATSHPIDLSPKPVMDQRDVLEFRYRGESVALESVRYTPDSVTCIPWHAPTDPRVAFLLKDVTNAKVYETGKSGDTAARVILVTLGISLFLLAQAFYRGIAD